MLAVVFFSASARSIVRCLVLLGEAGCGKTHELCREAHRLQERAPAVSSLLFDLGAVGSGEDLLRRVFESETFRAWRAGDDRLVLLLDGLDQGVLSISNLAKVLMSALAALGPELLARLSLRLACRTGPWQHHLGPYVEAELWKLFPQSAKVLALAPLRRSDVRLAAQVKGLDADALLSAVRAGGAETMAARPITLELLPRVQAAGALCCLRRRDLKPVRSTTAIAESELLFFLM